MKLKKAIHIVRNPFGWIESDVREARLAVCDEVERLEKEIAYCGQDQVRAKDKEIIRLRNDIELLRCEMKLIALALDRSKTDGESDCDWHDMADDVRALLGPWCVYVQGPDDLLAMPSKDAADFEAAKLNKSIGRKWEPGDPEINAIATLWPYSVALAEVLAESV